MLRADGTPLPNLLAAGGAARGVSGNDVSGYLSGNGLLSAVAAAGWRPARSSARSKQPERPRNAPRTFARAGAARSRIIAAMRQIVLDTETTGLSAEAGDRIIEIGCVELVARKLTGNNKHFYLNPERDRHEDALKVHGISNEFLRDKPRFAAIADELMEYLRRRRDHHPQRRLRRRLPEQGTRADRAAGPSHGHVAKVTDTLAMAKEMYPGKRNSLDALCDRLGVDNSGRTLHGALLDAELLADVYINLTRGQDALLIDEADAGAVQRHRHARRPAPVHAAGAAGQRAGSGRARGSAEAVGQGQRRQDGLASGWPFQPVA